MFAMSTDCFECAIARQHNGDWPFFEAGCKGCFTRALAELAIPRKPELPERQTLHATHRRDEQGRIVRGKTLMHVFEQPEPDEPTDQQRESQ